jgi:hypothetical protein
MKANSAYEVKHTRGGVAPALLADPRRVDVVEVVELDSGEAVALWDLTAMEARRIVHGLREDLLVLDAEDFLARCHRIDAELSGAS